MFPRPSEIVFAHGEVVLRSGSLRFAASLFWRSDAGKSVSHAPDYFARREDGSAVVVDCRPVTRRRPRDTAKFEATQAACAQVEWDFRLVGAPDPIVVRNVRRLAGYRHPRHRLEPVAAELLAAFVEPQPLMEGTSAVGDRVSENCV